MAREKTSVVVSEGLLEKIAATAPRFKPYPDYKESGVEWLGGIPAHWKMKRLKFAVACINDKQDSMLEGLEYIALEHIESWTGKRLESGNHLMPESQTSRFKPGDVLFGKLRPYLAKAWLAERDGICSTEFLVLRERDFEPVYLRYWVLTRPFIEIVDGSTYGTKMPRANWEFIGNTSVLVPPREEQRGIANFLDRETAKIDALVAKKERMIELLQEKRAALITQAVTKGLDPTVPMKDSGIEWLGRIPAHWEVKRLSHLTPPDRRIMYGIVLPGPHVDRGVPIVKGGDVSPERLRLNRLNRTSREIESRYVRSRLRGGDLVYAIRGSIGEVAMVPGELEGANLTQDAARIAYTTATHGPWLMYTLKSATIFAQLEAGALGATIRGINIRDLKRASLAVPPLFEQRSISDFLDCETTKIDAFIRKVREGIERLREYRSALISAAVTGKIDVRGAAPRESAVLGLPITA